MLSGFCFCLCVRSFIGWFCFGVQVGACCLVFEVQVLGVRVQGLVFGV